MGKGPKPMIYLLRNLKTGQFFKDAEEWTADQGKARQFDSMEQAIEVASGLESRDLEVFFGNGGIRLPVSDAAPKVVDSWRVDPPSSASVVKSTTEAGKALRRTGS